MLKDSQIDSLMAQLRAAKAANIDRYGVLNPIWSEVLDLLGYVLDLPETDVYRLRMHCGIFTGDIPWQFWHSADSYDAEAYARMLGYPQLTRDVPSALQMGEPENPYIPRPMGVSFRRLTVNANVVRFQSLVTNLYLTGIWRSLFERDDVSSAGPARVVEIGAGYGGLAEFFLMDHRRPVHFVAVDFPEILAFALGYVRAAHPDVLVKTVTSPDDFVTAPSDRSVLFLLPAFDADHLSGLPTIDLAFNTTGFQEMNTEDVVRYLDLIMPRLTGVFYSDNIDVHRLNKGQTEPLSTTYQRYGALWPQADVYDQVISDNQWDWFYSTFIFGPDAAVSSLNKRMRVFFGPGKTGAVMDFVDPDFSMVV